MDIGITGNIASGKSLAAALLKDILGAAVVDADAIGHYLLATNLDIQKMVCLEFGAEILDEQNNIDRQKLSRMVFSDLQNLNRLNKIYYPHLTYEIKMEILKAKNIFKYVILDAALIMEWGMQQDLDALIFIKASKEARLKRLMENRRLFQEDAENMISAQAEEAYKVDFADFVVTNEGSTEAMHTQMEKIGRIILSQEKDKGGK